MLKRITTFSFFAAAYFLFLNVAPASARESCRNLHEVHSSDLRSLELLQRLIGNPGNMERLIRTNDFFWRSIAIRISRLQRGDQIEIRKSDPVRSVDMWVTVRPDNSIEIRILRVVIKNWKYGHRPGSLEPHLARLVASLYDALRQRSVSLGESQRVTIVADSVENPFLYRSLLDRGFYGVEAGYYIRRWSLGLGLLWGMTSLAMTYVTPPPHSWFLTVFQISTILPFFVHASVRPNLALEIEIPAPDEPLVNAQ